MSLFSRFGYNEILMQTEEESKACGADRNEEQYKWED
jgi:hypothetical protein